MLGKYNNNEPPFGAVGSKPEEEVSGLLPINEKNIGGIVERGFRLEKSKRQKYGPESMANMGD